MSATELSWSLRATNRAAAEIDAALAARLGLRALDYAALGHVMEHTDEPLGPAGLGKRLGISTGSATELVDRLERAGHLERRREQHDRRRVSIVAREAAVLAVLEELGPLFAALDELAAQFDEAEQLVVNRYLRSATAVLVDFATGLVGPEGEPR